MISFEQALKTALDNCLPLESEGVDLQHALYRVLAEDVFADRDMPPFHKSAVDGYACKDVDDGDVLEVVETIPAGKTPDHEINKGSTSKIMTGAEVPKGADWVVMVEDSEPIDEHHIRILKRGRKSNIAQKGEDLKKGAPVLSSGTFLKPQHIGILASVGMASPRVSKIPTVQIITTGNELVEPNQKPTQSEIRNSNASQLIAQFQSIHIKPAYGGIITDNEEDVLHILQQSSDNYTLTVLTGGVSMGDYDFVPEMMERAGIKTLFHKIAIKPGKPTILGRKGNNLVVGLPGNPVSTFLQFELLLKPIVYALMGNNYRPTVMALPLGENIKSKKEKRDSWKPVQIIDGQIFTFDYHGSGHLHALHKTDGFICISSETEFIKKGSYINVRQI
jgi:molybdopterin molybdotransferase